MVGCAATIVSTCCKLPQLYVGTEMILQCAVTVGSNLVNHLERTSCADMRCNLLRPSSVLLLLLVLLLFSLSCLLLLVLLSNA